MLHRALSLAGNSRSGYDWPVDIRRRSAPAIVDPRNEPSYTLSEAARHLRLAPGTLRSWVVGRPYPAGGGTRTFAPLIRPAQKDPLVLSFWDSGRSPRPARAPDRPWRSGEGSACGNPVHRSGVEDRQAAAPGRPADASRPRAAGALRPTHRSAASGQLAMRKVLEAHLRRVDWDADRLQFRLFRSSIQLGRRREREVRQRSSSAFGRAFAERAGVSTDSFARPTGCGRGRGGSGGGLRPHARSD